MNSFIPGKLYKTTCRYSVRGKRRLLTLPPGAILLFVETRCDGAPVGGGGMPNPVHTFLWGEDIAYYSEAQWPHLDRFIEGPL